MRTSWRRLFKTRPAAGWRVTYRDQSGDKVEDFDFAVVSIGLYSETPRLTIRSA
jgi:hypothetical protein